MFATMIANVAIIFIPIYLYFRSNYAIADTKQLSFKKWLLFVCIESLVGIALVYLSWDFVGIPVDSRILFFSISMTYFGWKITIPSMLLAEVAHICHTGHATMLVGLVTTFLFAWSLYFVAKLAAKRFEAYGQLISLVLYNAVLKTVLVYRTTQDTQRTFLFFLVIVTLSLLITTGMFMQMADLRILRERSDYDYLTRLLNVRKFKERLTTLDKVSRADVSIAVLDLDLFKQFNDTYGHDAGDKILWGVAQVFAAYSSKNATVYRIGGEEFAVIMVGMSKKEAEFFIVDIMDNVVNRPIPLNREESVSVTLSVGLAFSREGETLHKLWKLADRAMYHSKENGRNQLTVAPTE